MSHQSNAASIHPRFEERARDVALESLTRGYDLEEVDPDA